MSQADDLQIRAVVEAYVLAMSTLDEEKLRRAFHPSASIIGNYHGSVEWLTVDAYVGEVMGAGLPPNESPSWNILSVDVTVDVANVKVEDAFGDMKFTNYISLLKTAGEWKIVSKVYHLHP